MESRNRIGEASRAGEAKSEEEIDGQGETKEESQAKSDTNKDQALIADLMGMLESNMRNHSRVRSTLDGVLRKLRVDR